MFFYSKIFIMLFLPIVLLGYYGCNKIKREKLGMMWLIASSLVLNVGVLFVFKYYNFFTDNLNALLHSDVTKLNLVMPLGISFFTFQQISYLVDCYHGEMLQFSLIDYAEYVFPRTQLIAGSIVLHNEWIPQIHLFFTPYSIAYWDSMYHAGSINVQMEATRIFTEHLLQYENVNLYCFYDNTNMICDLGNYVDTGHYKGEINDHILQWMIDGEYQWTEENYEKSWKI